MGKPKESPDPKPEDDFKPTILIMIERESNEDWIAACDALSEPLDQRGFVAKIIWGATCHLAIRDRSFQKHKNIWQTEAYMGASIQYSKGVGHSRPNANAE